jgi:hypothetical protein
LKARPKAWLSTPSNQCLQRLDASSTDCEEKRDPRQDATKECHKTGELDIKARLEKRSFANPKNQAGNLDQSQFPQTANDLANGLRE